MPRSIVFLVFLVCIGIAGPSGAETAGRLDKFRASGRISIGFPDASPPFAFLDGDAKPVGYSVEICEHIARKLATALGLPELDVRFTPVMSATRIPLIDNGTIDLECGTASNLPERHRLVAFAPTTFVGADRAHRAQGGRGSTWTTSPRSAARRSRPRPAARRSAWSRG